MKFCPVPLETQAVMLGVGTVDRNLGNDEHSRSTQFQVLGTQGTQDTQDTQGTQFSWKAWDKVVRGEGTRSVYVLEDTWDDAVEKEEGRRQKKED